LAISRSLPIVLLSANLAACVGSQKKQNYLFDLGSLSATQWQKIRAECRFEAAKSVATIKHAIIASEEESKIYILCVESKGVKYLGTEDSL
jgi:hypothetical protein